MKVKKFNEKYQSDFENDIATEYAKVILSEYIDNTEINLEQVYIDTINGDELDQNQAYIIKSQLIVFLEYVLRDAKKLREIHQIEADKYNL